MKIRSLTSFLLILAIFLSGCATRTKMAFESDAERLTESSPPVFLMTASIKNSYRTSFQPKLLSINVEKPGTADGRERFNFVMDDKARLETGVGAGESSYLLRLQLERGSYVVRGLSAMASTFPINAIFFVPLHASLESRGSGVFYLGHVSATVRERQGDEFKAGPSVPLIDQAIAGASGGTFEVGISDQLVKHEALIRAKLPALKGIEIRKNLLPPFDRAAAQKWWQEN